MTVVFKKVTQESACQEEFYNTKGQGGFDLNKIVISINLIFFLLLIFIHPANGFFKHPEDVCHHRMKSKQGWLKSEFLVCSVVFKTFSCQGIGDNRTIKLVKCSKNICVSVIDRDYTAKLNFSFSLSHSLFYISIQIMRLHRDQRLFQCQCVHYPLNLKLFHPRHSP